MKKICRWACRHRAGLLAFAVGFAAWGLFYIARRSTAAMDWWLAYVSMPIKRGLSFYSRPAAVQRVRAGRNGAHRRGAGAADPRRAPPQAGGLGVA